MKTIALLTLSAALAVTAAVTACAPVYAQVVRVDDGDLPKAPAITSPQYQIVGRVLTGPHDNTPLVGYSYNKMQFHNAADCQKFMENNFDFQATLPDLIRVLAHVVAQHPGSVAEVSCQPIGDPA